jgi:DNA-binding MarR family transcriptional regulator
LQYTTVVIYNIIRRDKMDKTNDINKLRETIRYIVRSLGILEQSEASCCGTTVGQCHAIVEVGRAKEISLNELAEILNLDKSTTSRTVNNLVNQGLAEREINPDDRRYLKIRLTEEGDKIFKTIEFNMNLYFKNVYESISEEKRQQVIESLEILLNALKKNKCC